MEMTLTLSVDEINAILQVLGELPTKSGAFPLVVKIKQQADEQMSKSGQKPDDAPPED